MKLTATPILGKDLKPGDLFSTAGQYYWDHPAPDSIGERVYIRTESPIPLHQEEVEVHRITVELDG